ncbi:uncharacterized protein LOC125200028 [Salvia hispanica]|uniref:uncharacterized protein LOC125200028 n=1 Tax=Salvia hispanica TaxID=49212 RepID=UPI0020090F71|nr:uncharacterized protein LOC125200028 [Salvia hispanica]
MSLSLKVMINKERTKVLFAESNSDFINVLLSFLTIPLGKLVTVLQKHNESAAIGSLTTLYKGLSELDTAHFSTRGAKEMLLNPRSSFQPECRKLALDVAGIGLLQHFLCEDVNCNGADGRLNISLYPDVAKCVKCGRPLNRGIIFGECMDQGGAFVISPLFFIISDDLRVAPIVTGNFEALTDFGISETQGAEVKSLCLGFHEILELLKLSLTSATPLTDMILKKNTVENIQYGIRLSHVHQAAAATESNKIVSRAFLHKSTNKFLFAESSDELVELLLSFLTVPLGGVEFLLGSSAPLKCIDNLYKSVLYGIDEMYFSTSDTKNRLINPKLPHGYLSKNQQLLPLSEGGRPKLYWKERWIPYNPAGDGSHSHTCYKKLNKIEFGMKKTMCFVSDDLTISPSLASRISILNDAGIPLSDVKEAEFHIGHNEALGILKASLISKTALTDGLIKPKSCLS